MANRPVDPGVYNNPINQQTPPPAAATSAPHGPDHGGGIFNHASTNRPTASLRTRVSPEEAMADIRAATAPARLSRAASAVGRVARGGMSAKGVTPSRPSPYKSTPEQPR